MGWQNLFNEWGVGADDIEALRVCAVIVLLFTVLGALAFFAPKPDDWPT